MHIACFEQERVKRGQGDGGRIGRLSKAAPCLFKVVYACRDLLVDAG